MSSNPPQNTPGANTPWGRPTPHRLGFRTVRRGRDKQWHFPGQEPDEIVRIAPVRKHKWFLILPAWPLLVSSILLFLLLVWAGPSVPGLQAVWFVLEILAGILVVGTAIYFLYKDFVVWFYETSIITNKRIIKWGARGGSILNPSRQETPLDRVTQVSVDQDDLWQIILNYGNVHIYYVGGQIELPDVPRPKMVKESVQHSHEEVEARKPPKEVTPLPKDPLMDALLQRLAKPEEIDKLPDADQKYIERHPERADKPRGPRRTFGGPLRISCDVRYTFDEYTVEYIQRSRYVLVWRLLPPAILLAITIAIGFLFPSIFVIIGFLVLVWLIVGGLIVIDYVDDVYILTNKRIIDIQRKLVIFFEDRIEIDYKNIRDILLESPNVLEYFLNIGDVRVQTPGTSPDIVFDGVDHPFHLQDKIFFLKDYKDQTDKKKAKNERKEELYNWFGNVTTLLEQRATHKGVPDLQMLDFYTAAERARAFGMKVVFKGEDSSHPNVRPGVIIMQNPLPGTLLEDNIEDANGNKIIPEIHVILSRR